MTMSEGQDFIQKGKEALRKKNFLEALACFERASKSGPEDPKVNSFIGLCIAHERGSVEHAITVCEKALKNDPHAVDCYVNLGKVYRKAELNSMAVEIFRKGLTLDRSNPDIISELQSLGVRRKPAIKLFPREHVVNKVIGLFLDRTGIR